MSCKKGAFSRDNTLGSIVRLINMGQTPTPCDEEEQNLGKDS